MTRPTIDHAVSAALPALCLGLGALVAYNGAQARSLPAPPPSYDHATTPMAYRGGDGPILAVQSVQTLNNYQGGSLSPAELALYRVQVQKGFEIIESLKKK